ncbi:hypothetical protein BO82DRAFT_31677 [Aspergillus uvarum CBS 121591]|uniref:Uncharacterized protein n=1 Tax=Aspergillus uvarum CBS 121591 TaxID=1448315 RepID=A0A319DYU0_9EURO|nr:hypothetical protein BO82DRAFT_31677 [Aspergillus uvarum CBS 121591]PYH84062.1 hypothetical protein BO82DRAFT_31677 [Aspergillus uvarum CBS 121591]
MDRLQLDFLGTSETLLIRLALFGHRTYGTGQPYIALFRRALQVNIGNVRAALNHIADRRRQHE